MQLHACDPCKNSHDAEEPCTEFDMNVSDDTATAIRYTAYLAC